MRTCTCLINISTDNLINLVRGHIYVLYLSPEYLSLASVCNSRICKALTRPKAHPHPLNALTSLVILRRFMCLSSKIASISSDLSDVFPSDGRNGPIILTLKQATVLLLVITDLIILLITVLSELKLSCMTEFGNCLKFIQLSTSTVSLNPNSTYQHDDSYTWK